MCYVKTAALGEKNRTIIGMAFVMVKAAHWHAPVSIRGPNVGNQLI